MIRLEKIINNRENEGLDFIIHIQNKEELNDLIIILERNDFKIQLSFDYKPNELKAWMQDICDEYGYDNCFRIRNRKGDRCIAFNPSIEHWRMFCNDILEIRSGELEFNEGEYTLDTAKIEAQKILRELCDGSSVFEGIGFTKETKEKEIIDWLMSLNNN